MKTTKLLFGCLVALLLLCIAGSALADMKIDAEHFPDPIFQLYVQQIIDTDQNGVLSDEEIEAVEMIYCPEVEIRDLTGIECFPNLQALMCDSNKISSLDVSGNPLLVSLSCADNNLSSLDVSQNFYLMELYCDDNMLHALDVSQNPFLMLLSCQRTQLTALDLSQNEYLAALDCSVNLLSTLDVSRNPDLQYLNCSSCQLEALDVSQNQALVSLICFGNHLTYLDVSHNQALETLSCSSNWLAALDLSQNTALTDCNLSLNTPNFFAEHGVFDLSTLPGFDITKTSDWDISSDLSLNGTILRKRTSTTTHYTYDCGNGFEMRVVPFVHVVGDPILIRGDVTADDVVDGRDALRLLKYLAGQDVIIDWDVSDVNEDGGVDGRDVLRLMKMLAGQ